MSVLSADDRDNADSIANRHCYSVLKKTGKPPMEPPPMGPAGLFDVCGLQDLMAFDASVGGQAFANGV